MNNNNNKKPNSAKSKQLTLLLTLLCLRVTSAGASVRSLLLWPLPVPTNYTVLPCCWQSNYNPITLPSLSKHHDSARTEWGARIRQTKGINGSFLLPGPSEE